jgi:hypothetical protein
LDSLVASFKPILLTAERLSLLMLGLPEACCVVLKVADSQPHLHAENGILSTINANQRIEQIETVKTLTVWP